jgi:HTH-type transcriptional regulator/antitoxin HigA
MELEIIRSKKDYATALQRFEQVFQAKMGTPESDEADVLALLIKNYEAAQFPIATPDTGNSIDKR